MRRIIKIVGWFYMIITGLTVFSLVRDIIFASGIYFSDILKTLFLIVWLGLIGLFFVKRARKLKGREQETVSDERTQFLHHFKKDIEEEEEEE